MRREQVVGFAGKVEHLELQHIIQIACLAGISATIIVRQGNQKGYIYVRSGQLIHAAVSGLAGQEAVNEMVGMESRSIRFEAWYFPGGTANASSQFHRRYSGSYPNIG